MMRRTLVAAAVCVAAAFGTAPAARAQSLEETIGRVLQGFGGPGQDPRYDPREAERWQDDRRPAYSDRMEARERLETLDEADRRLDAQQRRIDADRRRIEEERRRLLR